MNIAPDINNHLGSIDLFSCPSSSIPTLEIHSFIYYIQFIPTLVVFALPSTMPHNLDDLNNLDNLNKLNNLIFNLPSFLLSFLCTKDIFYNSDFK